MVATNDNDNDNIVVGESVASRLVILGWGAQYDVGRHMSQIDS